QNGRENLEIYVGEGDSGGNPSIAVITPGHQKIVQPITLYRSPDHGPLSSLMGIYTLSKVSPDGRVRTEGANRATGIGGTGRIEGGQTLEAYIYLEIGTLNAAAPRNAASAVWGKVDKGLQCGIRMISTRKSYEVGDTLEAELLWRNAGDKKAHWVHPRQLDLWPIIRDASGRGLLVNTGARFELIPGSADYAPGEVRSLGTLKVTLVPEGTPSPKSNREPGHITLAPGTYFFSGSGGVSREGDPCPHSGEVTFTVVGNAPSKSDVELSLRLPKGVTTFSKLSEARFEVVLRNLGKPTKVSWITPANFAFYGPEIFTNERVPKPIPYVHTVGGPYRGEGRQLASGETIVLGTIPIPREARATLDALPRPGPTVSTDLIVPPLQFYAYDARFSLGITVAGKSEQKLSARLPFTVSRS
ncbi:hypothetical protein, partial [Armatimonas sp.]|uniref:hypothetical protein n=1 Tax=Armatimonas sp. TaxID=1872638 RepID=UPI0037510B9F